MKRRKLTIAIRSDLDPHPLDGKIMYHYRKLKRLIAERAIWYMSVASKGRAHAADHVASRASAHRGKKHPTAGEKIASKLRGRKLTPAARAKISEGMRRHHEARQQQ